MKPSQLMLLICALWMASCSPQLAPPTPTSDLSLMETVIAGTLTAAVPPTATEAPPTQPPSATPAPETPAPSLTPTLAPSPTAATASVSGKVCYRTSQVPAMTAYFQESESKAVVELPIAAGQITYTVDLPPGTYTAYAWLPDFSLGGLYSKALTCGLGANCTDHAPVPFTVAVGDRLSGVDLCDWYAFAVPLPPGKSGEKVNGALTGRVDFPGGSNPVLHVVAFSRTSGYWYYVLTLAGQTNFTLTDLPPGEYVVVAYTREGQAGGYTEGGQLKPVTVRAGETASVVLSGWDVPSGAFPEDPTEW